MTGKFSSFVQGIVFKTLVSRHRLVSTLHSEHLNTTAPGGNFINLCQIYLFKVDIHVSVHHDIIYENDQKDATV
jgi:hypothetical protein